MIGLPDMTVFSLKLHTRQDFGMDAAKWRDWLSGRGDVLQVGPTYVANELA